MSDADEGRYLMDRRKDGWSWTKEIIGTMVGVILIMTPPAAWFLIWSRDVSTSVALLTLEVAHLKEAKLSDTIKQTNTDSALTKILEQVTEIRIQAARSQLVK